MRKIKDWTLTHVLWAKWNKSTFSLFIFTYTRIDRISKLMKCHLREWTFWRLLIPKKSFRLSYFMNFSWKLTINFRAFPHAHIDDRTGSNYWRLFHTKVIPVPVLLLILKLTVVSVVIKEKYILHVFFWGLLLFRGKYWNGKNKWQHWVHPRVDSEIHLKGSIYSLTLNLT